MFGFEFVWGVLEMNLPVQIQHGLEGTVTAKLFVPFLDGLWKATKKKSKDLKSSTS